MLKIFASGGITFCQELQKKDKYISEALADPRMESWGALVRKEGKRNNQTGLSLNDLLACLNINNLPPRQPPLQVPGLILMAQTSETFSIRTKPWLTHGNTSGPSQQNQREPRGSQLGKQDPFFVPSYPFIPRHSISRNLEKYF